MSKIFTLLLVAFVLGGAGYTAGKKSHYVSPHYSAEVVGKDLQVNNLTPTLGLKTSEKVKLRNKSKLIILEKANTVVFRGEVTNRSVANAQFQIQQAARNLPKGKPIYLVLDTPGGSVFAGLNLIDFVKGLDREVHTISLFAASMGFQFVQNFNKRYVAPNGVLMSHRAAGGVKGQFDGELEQRYAMIKRIIDKLDTIASNRMNTDIQSYKASIKDELWSTGLDTLRDSVADEVVGIKCGKSLQGTVTKEVITFFGRAELLVSECPLIRGFLGAKIKRVNKNFTENEAQTALEKLYFSPQEYLKKYMLNDTRYTIFGNF